eukprot:SAG31_NODE_1381_length_8580_cov_5.632590_2_plen_90_part_00
MHAHVGLDGQSTALVIINFSTKKSFSLNVGNAFTSGKQWQLRGQPRANAIFLNDNPLRYDAALGGLMKMPPKTVHSLELPPVSVTFCLY